MNENPTQWVPYLRDPLVLVGFFLLLFFGFGRFIVKSKLIRKLSQRHGYRVLQTFLLYGFIAGLAIIALGFGLKFHDISKGEQQRVLAMLAQESKANLSTAQELSKNTTTLLQLTTTLATTLREPRIRLLTTLFPQENLQPTPSTKPPLELARSAFATLEASKLHRDPIELARFTAVGKLVHGTVERTLSTVESLSDPAHSRYRIYDDVWKAQLPVLRKIDAFPVTPYQESYSQLAKLRANYDVTVRHAHDYTVSLGDFFSGSQPISQERLTNVLAQERLTMSVLAEYGSDLTVAAERLKTLEAGLPIATASSPTK